FLIILGGIIYFVLSTPKMIHMPDVVNEEYDDAKETLEENQLKVNKKMMSSEEVEEGLVIKTDPEANRSVKEKSTVNVFVRDRKSTRLNSSHVSISYAVFCLKKKKTTMQISIHT